MVGPYVRANYGASLSSDATVFAHIVDDGGYPRAVQRFLRGWRASSSRDVVLPVDGAVTRVIHSPDDYWLACQVAPGGGTCTQIWVVTTDPDDPSACRIDRATIGTAELIGWDGTRVAAVLTDENGIGASCLIDPSDGNCVVLDRRSGGRLVDAWAGASLVRVGPRGYRELILLHGLTETALLPSDPGSCTDAGIPGPVADELSISASGSMIAITVEGPSMPRTVELVDPRTRGWMRIDREPSRGPVVAGRGTGPTLEMISARDGLTLPGWLYRPPTEAPQAGALIYLHGGPEAQARPGYDELFPNLLNAGITVFTPNVRGSSGFGRTFMHADDKEKRFAAINDVADCVRFLIDNGHADENRIACGGRSYGGFLTLAALTFHPELFAAGVSICGMSDLSTFYRNTKPWFAEAAYSKYGHPVNDRALFDQLSPLRRADALTAPLLVVHGAKDANVPPSESEQIVEALRERGRNVRYLLFEDDGHEISKRENHEALVTSIGDWLTAAFATGPGTARNSRAQDQQSLAPGMKNCLPCQPD